MPRDRYSMDGALGCYTSGPAGRQTNTSRKLSRRREKASWAASDLSNRPNTLGPLPDMDAPSAPRSMRAALMAAISHVLEHVIHPPGHPRQIPGL